MWVEYSLIYKFKKAVHWIFLWFPASSPAVLHSISTEKKFVVFFFCFFFSNEALLLNAPLKVYTKVFFQIILPNYQIILNF